MLGYPLSACPWALQTTPAKLQKHSYVPFSCALQLQAAEARRRAQLRGEVSRDPGHVRMEELRALQQLELTPDDAELRFRKAQETKPVSPEPSCACILHSCCRFSYTVLSTALNGQNAAASVSLHLLCV